MSEHKQTVLVDVDGVLAEYDGWDGLDNIGNPIPGARGFLNGLQTSGYEIVIYSTRANAVLNADELSLRERATCPETVVRKLAEWLDEHNMPYDRIETGKPLAVAIIDDRAVPCRPQSEDSVQPGNSVEEFEKARKTVDQIANSK